MMHRIPTMRLSVPFVHWKVGDPAELEHTLAGETKLMPDPEPCRAGERRKTLRYAADKKNRIAVSEPQLAAQLDGRRRAEASCDRPGAFSVAPSMLKIRHGVRRKSAASRFQSHSASARRISLLISASIGWVLSAARYLLQQSS